ncbi:hypothetical protein B0H66DRAFT_607406 [Apodospora peruviana]|uniref:Uncharacterized protein n=1 Tax=Apodospora peruviana TaxID=516989 RepID=A0AAE0HX22_9PEZI|nr:hypothetical protein B0H66DRAFT_607406 [Apodospora peruviana]
MSGATSNLAHKTFQKAIERWPKDPLRPLQLQDVLAKRLQARNSLLPKHESGLTGTAKADAERKQVNALYSLIENRYQHRYKPQGVTRKLLEPESNPTYYKVLMQELEEVQTRTWLQAWWIRVKGKFRFKP